MSKDALTEKTNLFQNLQQLASFITFASCNSKSLQARGLVESARTTLALANMELAKTDCHHPIYARRVWEFDQVMVSLTKGKWFATRARQGQEALGCE